MLTICGLLGIWTVTPVFWFPPLLVYGLVTVLLMVLGLALRKRWLRRAAVASESLSRLAWVPTVCIIFSFTAYGGALVYSQQHYYLNKLIAYERFRDQADEKLAANTEALASLPITSPHEKREIDQFEQIINIVSGKSVDNLGERLLIPGLHQAREKERFERVLVSAGQGRRFETLTKRARFSPNGVGATFLAAVAELRLVNATRVPSEHELPPWFGRLTGFFTLATQILAGLVVALAFSRWRSGASEELFRAAMPVATVGIAFGLAGNLPLLSRSLQAIFLGPVIAGLACAIGAMIAVTASRPEVRPSNRPSV